MSKKAPEFRLVRDGELRVVDSAAQAVALEFDGWQREEAQADEPNDAGASANPASSPDPKPLKGPARS